MLEELKTDFSTYKENIETPIFHRIKFDKIGRSNCVNVYLTKITFYDMLVSGNYRIFSWHDYRAKAFLGFELDDESPKLGRATLIGMFKPSNNDLEDVQYVTGEGKSYFPSAYEAINNIDKEKKEIQKIVEIKKINIESFIKLGEIIPTGAQGKAIYGEGNYIIDGPAGTGKSTTVLQKIKIIKNQMSVSLSQIVVLVKNEQVVQSFNDLLQSIDVKNFGIYAVDRFIEEIGYGENNITDQDLINYKNKVLSFIGLFESCTNINKRISNIRISHAENILV